MQTGPRDTTIGNGLGFCIGGLNDERRVLGDLLVYFSKGYKRIQHRSLWEGQTPSRVADLSRVLRDQSLDYLKRCSCTACRS